MKHLLLCLLLLGFYQCTLGQTSDPEKIWVTFVNQKDVPVVKDGVLRSTSPEVQQLIENYTIINAEQALPDSRRKDLKKVYELECQCNASELINDINNGNGALRKPEPAPKYELLSTPNDFSVTFSNDYALGLIRAEGAWDYTTGDTNVIIGISDGNFYVNHEELQGEYVSNNTWTTPTYYYHHGTAVAVTAAGATDNGVGKSSIGYNCRMGLGGMSYNTVLQLVYSGVEVINLSWSSGCYPSGYVQNVMDEAHAYGTIVVAAAGNGGTCGGASNLVYPAACDHVIAVSSVGPNDNHERTSGDPSSTHQHNSSVDICAPGYDVALTISSGYYLTGNGSSFAAPYVSGTIGLMLSLNPCLTLDKIEEILYLTADNIDAQNPSYIGMLGAGRLNAEAALQMTKEMMPKAVPTDISCFGFNDGAIDVANMSNNPSNSFAWNTISGSSLLSSVPNQTGLSAGMYSVTMTDGNGCSIIDTVTIVEPSDWADSSIVTTHPGGDHISCNGVADGEIDLNVSNGSSNYTYQWDLLNGLGTTNDEDLDLLSAGTYAVVVTDDNGCEYQRTFNLTEPAQLSGSYTTSDFLGNVAISCNGEADGVIDYTVLGGAPSYTYKWYKGGNLFSQDEDLSGVEAGVYVVEATDTNGCIVSDTISLIEPSALDVEIDVLTDYFGLPVSCRGMSDAIIEASVSGGTPGYSFVWTGSIGQTELLSDLGEGTYEITYTDANGCDASRVVELKAHELPIPTPGLAVEACEGEPVTFGADVAPNETCFWSLSNGMEFDMCGNNTVLLDEVDCYGALLKVTNEFGCSDSIYMNDYICIHENPVASFNIKETNPTVVENQVSFENTSLNASNYEWDFEGGGYTTEESPVHDFPYDEVQEYAVTLTAHNKYGCWDTTTQYVKVNDELLFYVPNSFTPNGDMHNNVFTPVLGSGFTREGYLLSIYNRWGELIFESRDTEIGWDGTYQGTSVSPGTYLWVMSVYPNSDVLNTPEEDTYKGEITLLY